MWDNLENHGDKTAWQFKAHKEKCQEGYGNVSYEDVWCLDERLANIIATHLRAFLKAAKGPPGGCPGILTEGCGIDAGRKKWLQIIRKMI